MASGNILRMNPDGSTREVFASTGGRVLGFDFDASGNLVAADAIKGLLSISPERKITLPTNTVGSEPIRHTDAVVVAGNGKMYLRDASARFAPAARRGCCVGAAQPSPRADWRLHSTVAGCNRQPSLPSPPRHHRVLRPSMYRLPRRVTRRFHSTLIVVCCLLGGAATADRASAQDAPNQADAAGEPARRFASVWRIRGDISATAGETGPARRLQAGDPVYVGERVRADASAEVVLKTEDAGLLAVRPGGVFIAERFAAEGKPTDNLTLRLVVGSVRVISGWIARINRPDYRVVTQTTTIGIRGTDHEPYVISAELAAALSQPAGTYDKVNRGGTTLDVNGNKLDIEPGKVGFVRAPRVATTRALMTLLLPVLLDKVPDFYVPGEFDAELDLLSQTADDNAVAQLEERRKAPAGNTTTQQAASPAGTAGATTMVAPATAVAAAGAQDASRGNTCGATGVARSWLAQLDGAIVRRNAPAIQRLFAPQVVVQATVRDKDGKTTTVEVSRDEFARSAGSAVKGLSDYQQRRMSIDGQPEVTGACDRIAVKSVVIEQGKQNGAAYRFESTEEFTLERRAGRWLATRAATTQR